MNNLTSTVFGLVISLASGSVLAQSTYRLIDLGSLYGESRAFAVRDEAMAIGSSTAASADFRAVFFSATAAPVELPSPATERQAVGFAIDGAGRIIGCSYDLSKFTPVAFRIEQGSAVPLGPFVARAVNASGVIAGTANVISTGPGAGMTLPRACRFDGTVTMLGTLGGLASQGLGIDDSGRVVGSSTTQSERGERPCVWTTTSTTPLDLGTLGGLWGQATAINGNRVVGTTMTSAGRMHATLWTLNASGGVISVTDLGTTSQNGSSFAKSINGLGVAVGTSDFRATRFVGGTATDLNNLIDGLQAAWRLEVAWAITDSGVIVGSGSRLGFPRAFMLVPCPVSGCGVICDGIDFNNDTSVFDSQDIDALLSVFSEGPCIPATATCNDIDFNNDGSLFDPCDIDAFLLVFSEGPCTPCGQ